ncbi:hypothetical protein BV898_04313 [Hypsibius exemplaris]|uniref:Uncharacterized protein n=1 Tax=Hypsibius exemplaris TaxID=2072580 RepID=A0A1W0X2P3_HYPEX|nr:hypothetical protein BV898_04313 [Hypsibius exemplaris]
MDSDNNSAWQLPITVTLAVIGGGMAVGLLVICVICGFCSIFNRKYDKEQLKKRRVSIKADSVHSTQHRPPTERTYSSVPARPILTVRNATTSCRPDLLESGQIHPVLVEEIGRINPVGAAGSLSDTGGSTSHCQHCSSAFPVQVTRTATGATITSVLRHACACRLFMSTSVTSVSERSITGDELRQLASSTEAIFSTNELREGEDQQNRSAPRNGRHAELSPLLTRDTDPLIVLSNSTSSETVARTRRTQGTASQLSRQLDPSGSSCCVTPLDENQEQSQATNRCTPSRPVHVHPLLHPHFHTHSKDDLPIEDEVSALTQADVHRTQMTFQALQLPPGESQSVSPMSDFDGSELELAENDSSDPCKALWGLRSVLEMRTNAKPEPMIRLIGESDNEMEIVLDDAGLPVSQGGNQLQPGDILTSLTSFESNTPSEESFDATTCARALEAIFDEPSDLPTLQQDSVNAYCEASAIYGYNRSLSSATTSTIYGSNTHLTPPARQKRKPSPPKLTSHQKRLSFKKAHHLAAAAGPKSAVASPVVTVTTTKAVTTADEAIPTAPVVSNSVDNPEKPVRSSSPHRLTQMKNDSGYKSQSLDHGTSTTPQIHIQPYKSVPFLPSERVSEEPLDVIGHGLDKAKMQRYNASSLEVPNASFFLSASTDNEMEASTCGSSAVPSLSSSMDMDSSFACIPLLLTQPATPTTPTRDWTIDERSDRLFREFSRREAAFASGSRSTLRSATRQHRSLLPKRKSYSPSSSHGGTPAQASIEETEEDEEQTLCGSGSSKQDDASPVDRRPSTSSRRSITPDFFVCSTKEQYLNQINMRAQSPELRHVPIIKLPDQESDEV